MREQLRLARPFLVLLGVVAVGRWLHGVFAYPYEKGHHIFSIVTLTVFSCLYYGIFLRRWRSARLMQAIGVGFTLGVASQLVILLLTALSYALGMHTYFNNPAAMNSVVPLDFAMAMQNRVGGLVGNSIFAGIVGALGWALGGLLPEK
jgi:hypothetical protein